MTNSETHSIATQLIELPIPGGEYTMTPFQENDISTLQSVLVLEQVSNPLIAVPKPYTIEDAKFWVSAQVSNAEKLMNLTTVIERRQALFSQDFGMPIQVIRYNGTFVGCCTLTPTKEEGKVELGYYLHPSHHKKGIMKAAAREVLKLGAKEWGVQKVYASADLENFGSQKILGDLVLEKGMSNVVKGEKVLSWPAGKYGDEKCDRLSYYWEWDLD